MRRTLETARILLGESEGVWSELGAAAGLAVDPADLAPRVEAREQALDALDLGRRLCDVRFAGTGVADDAVVGEIGAAAQWLQVHPNTVRYRVRRIEKLLSTSLSDPEVRLLFSLGLRATERSA